MRYDIIIAGGGIVGLATAYYLQRSRPELKIALLEKEKEVAAHQSSHNSGVLHSGIYYKPGSLRAVNCRRGYEWMLQFCREQGIPFDVCGKIIVAAEKSELEALDKIYHRGLENGLTGLRKISPEEAREREPHVRCEEAVLVPQAGIVDFGRVARRIAAIFQENGGQIFLEQPVEAVKVSARHVTVETGKSHGKAWECGIFVNCGGLYSDKIAQMTGQATDIRIIPFRGEYYELKHESEHLVRHLIYPVPNPNFPFLGVHFTRMIQGGIEAGPNAVLAFKREGYSRWDIHPGELAETLRFSGFRKIAGKYWRDGWLEMQRSYYKPAFVQALQRLTPDIRSSDLVPGRAGVRAMACDAQGNLLDDFLILTQPRVVNVCNAPSPAATASLSIGTTIGEKVLEQC